jgi:hypothetical protein
VEPLDDAVGLWAFCFRPAMTAAIDQHAQ